ncbi:ABC-type transport system ATP-binding protein [Natronomonas pharaonis DSM 2160]|uniref:ABC-type transport system ATP-binding protein n=1 Tax=Natronomonas pharaonis (strain ATCC 35678 / DSM 2160 / CIP 103997 / JCM 8858 / NBRC 14720 / NCIMB 2260 / Gabara) TaxID=348780 RepID=A0A1U7EUH7_NATPD|nr:ABC transporter ATP-binding protein [Natronomonas pharaonis]CAI48632.1 ABC-type transport system ATP-binding protein [Natronomonas pharaonis DSM 2160]
MAAIELDGVEKAYGDVQALSGVDLEVEEGEIFGFLGPNGAGKSTTINILLDFVRPDAGSVRVLGYDAGEESVAVRERTGVLPEGFSVYDRLSAREHVAFAVDSKDADDDPEALLERVGLEDDAGRKAGGFSTGMRQRLALAMALAGDPDLLVLDEPSSGLDPNGARELREIVEDEAENGATVFFSSHILGQVEAVCDRVGIIRNGEVVATDSISGLRDAVGDGSTLVVEVDTVPDGTEDRLSSLDGVGNIAIDGTTLRVNCEDGVKTAVVSELEAAGATVEDFSTEEASLEELFAAYTEGQR